MNSAYNRDCTIKAAAQLRQQVLKWQFITRKAVNNDILQKTENILDDYFNSQGITTW